MFKLILCIKHLRCFIKLSMYIPGRHIEIDEKQDKIKFINARDVIIIREIPEGTREEEIRVSL